MAYYFEFDPIKLGVIETELQNFITELQNFITKLIALSPYACGDVHLSKQFHRRYRNYSNAPIW